MIRIGITKMNLVPFIKKMPAVLKIMFFEYIDHFFEIGHGIEDQFFQANIPEKKGSTLEINFL